MAVLINEDKVFEKIKFSRNPLPKGEYENCTFKDCDFYNVYLSSFIFVDCGFQDCNLSLTKFSNTALKTVSFKNCKALGVNFAECNDFLFSVNFEDCLLNLSSFYKLKLKGANFKNCSLHEGDFTETDLTNAIFDNCDLSGAIFKNSNLEKADLRTAYNFSIDPEINRMKKAKFSRMGLDGLLHKYNIDIE